jgi:hypothetical protein
MHWTMEAHTWCAQVKLHIPTTVTTTFSTINVLEMISGSDYGKKSQMFQEIFVKRDQGKDWESSVGPHNVDDEEKYGTCCLFLFLGGGGIYRVTQTSRHYVGQNQALCHSHIGCSGTGNDSNRQDITPADSGPWAASDSYTNSGALIRKVSCQRCQRCPAFLQRSNHYSASGIFLKSFRLLSRPLHSVFL